MLYAAVLALLVLPCAAYFEVDSTGFVEDHCPFIWPDYTFGEDMMTTGDADVLFSCNALPSDVESEAVNVAIAGGMSKANATANLCFGRGCWYAQSVTMEATVSIPPGELMHNGFPFSNTYNLTKNTLPGGENVTGLCFPPKFLQGGGYLCLVDRPPKDARRALASIPNAASTTWLLAADYVPVTLTGFATPQVDDHLKMLIIIAAAVLLLLILLGILSGGGKPAGAAQL